MLFSLVNHLAPNSAFANLFNYITFRAGLSLFFSFIIGLIIIKKLITILRNFHQPIRDDGPKTHIDSKKNTPTMGGVGIVLAATISTLLFADLSNGYILICLASLILFFFIGLIDDLKKVLKKNTKGVSGKMKLLLQISFSFLLVYAISLVNQKQGIGSLNNFLFIPFVKSPLYLDLGLFYMIFAVFVVTGSSNAVNLTDGLDGLVSVPMIITVISFSIIAYLAGNAVYSNYLKLVYIPGSGEIVIFCAAIVGACMAFLWYNCYPAQIFMGDAGSLALGGAVAVIAIIVKSEILLAIIGGLFVIEAVSVMLQVWSYKTRGKRIFKMAPIHHHFEQIGWSESKVIVRFWIIAVVFALIGLASLKIR